MLSSPLDNRSPLLSRLRADQSERWQRGDTVRVEHYLAEYPDLASDAAALLDLILAEAMLREERGDTPALDEYIARFPAQAEALRRQWELARLLPRGDRSGNVTASDLLTVPETGEPSLPGLPGFELLAEVGRGGMGVVFKARQIDLDRPVAMKLIRTGPLAGREEMARFRTEARAVARLKHPGVVQVHTFGEHAGCLYLVMEYLPGGSLSARLRQGLLPLREAVLLVRDLARAMQAAHEAQVVHRDLKPSNVLLDEGGAPKVSDFGLARLLDAESEFTHSEMVLGTPVYMAPEQAAGRTKAVGPLADVWALGVILYECLAGRPPFKGETRSQTMEQVRTQDPPPLRPLRPEVPADLEAACLLCLEKEPTRRYGSAAELADDLDRWLGGQPLRARPPGRLRRAGRWLRHRRTAVAGFVGAAVLLVAASVVLEARDPDRPLRRVQDELTHGQRVTLVEPGGVPRWSRWALEPATTTRHRDGSFQIESWGSSLLELVRDPQLTRYRLRAMIRHEASQAGAVGLVVGRHDFPLRNATGQFFLAVTFNDVEAEADRIIAPAAVPPLNRVNLAGIMQTGDVGRGSGHSSFACLPEKRLFRPSKPGARRWLALAVEVTPDWVRVVFENQLVGEATASHVRDRGERAWRRLLRGRPDLNGLPYPARFELRGGLGLFVSLGTASFKDVVLEPLEES